MSFSPAIKVKNISKCYPIYDAPGDRLKQFVFPKITGLFKKNQRQYYREFLALKDISFEIQRGETVGIIGRNGSGKSTLLQIIANVLSPSSGTVQTNGRIATILELGSGFNVEFTGRENVYMNAMILGLRKEEIDKKFDAIASFADIGDFIDQPVKIYSTGMLMRLAFAVIAHVDADILIVDEALAVGDVFFVQKCMSYLREFSQRGTLIFVSHDMGAVLGLCDRALWLQNGHLLKIGEPKDLAEDYLQLQYEEQKRPKDLLKVQQEKTVEILPESVSEEITFTFKAQPRDMRQDFINQTSLRNDIELFEFRPNAKSFGEGGAKVNSVWIEDICGDRLSWVVGGEEVTLVVICQAHCNMKSPIIGFIVKDRLGQPLFGDNTYLSHIDKPLHAQNGEYLKATFSFRMPLLLKGDYVVTVALADGTQTDHTQQNWIHDAFAFTVHSTSLSNGLVGVPMTRITLFKNQ